VGVGGDGVFCSEMGRVQISRRRGWYFCRRAVYLGVRERKGKTPRSWGRDKETLIIVGVWGGGWGVLGGGGGGRCGGYVRSRKWGGGAGGWGGVGGGGGVFYLNGWVSYLG